MIKINSFLKLALLAAVLQIVDAQTTKVPLSRDSQGVMKPNYCRNKACIKCVDKGGYFGCEKCIYYGTKNKDIHKCDDLTIKERESKFLTSQREFIVTLTRHEEVS